MPTKPHEPIIYRELSKIESEPIRTIAQPLLKELVNYASNVIIRCANSSKHEINEDVSMLCLFRHIIEMTDGIEVLIGESCVNPW